MLQHHMRITNDMLSGTGLAHDSKEGPAWA